MNDPHLTPHGDEALEARIVAWVLGESSAFEADELSRLCEERPEWMIFRRRILALHQMLGEAESAPAASDEWRLPAAKRAVLEAAWDEAGPLPAASAPPAAVLTPSPRPRGRIPGWAWLSAAACVVLVPAVAFLSATAGSKGRKSYAAATADHHGMVPLRSKLPPELIEGTPRPMNVPGLIDPSRNPQLAVQSSSPNQPRSPEELAAVTESMVREMPAMAMASEAQAAMDGAPRPATAPPPSPASPTRDSAAIASRQTGESTPSSYAYRAAGQELGDSDSFGRGWGDADGLDAAPMALAGSAARFAGQAPGNGVPPAARERRLQERTETANEAAVDPFAAADDASTRLALRAAVPASATAVPVPQESQSRLETASRTNPALTREHTQNVDEVRRNLYRAEGNYNLGKFDEAKKEYENVIRIDPYNTAARRGLELLSQARSDYYRAAYDHTRADLLMQVDEAWNLPTDKLQAAPAAEAAAKEMPPAPDMDQETQARDEPFSTFSLHVSDASFRAALAALRQGRRPDPAEIHVEQFYNAFDFGDPAPAAGEPVAAAFEQCAHPLLPGRILLRSAVRTAAAGRSPQNALDLTLLIDQSGSMVREDRREALREALLSLAAVLGPDDKVTAIAFSRESRLLREQIPGNQIASLLPLLADQAAEDGTNLEQALQVAAEIAGRQNQAKRSRRIVLLTDGAANLGDADPARLAQRIGALRQQGIATDIAGIGADGVNNRLLGELARHGDGRHHILDPGEGERFARDLAGAFRPAAQDVKVQVVFQPERVGGYRLCGFEQHRLRTEDFRDDSVDAAELAAEEAGVALYQIETLPNGRGELGELFVRFRETESGQIVERSWPIRHQADSPPLDRASPSMQLAVLALLAGEKLRGGPLAAGIDFRQLAPVRAQVRQAFPQDERVTSLLEMIDRL